MARTTARRIVVSTLTAMLAAAALAIAACGAEAAAPAAHAAAHRHHARRHHARGTRRRHHARKHHARKHHARKHHARKHHARKHHARKHHARKHHARRHGTRSARGRRGGIHFSGGLTVSSGRTVVAPQVPAGPCPNADLEPSAGDLAQINQATLCLINKERVARGLGALAENAKLDAAAAHHTNDMIANDYFDHTSPSGETMEQRIRAAGYIPTSAGYEIGENIALGTSGLDTPAQIVAAWMNSAGHRANILDPNYLETGLAATAAVPAQFGGGQPGGTYTQNFGVINTG
jgi:uncharacterized protein YkwD